jgi:hypothetical protein
MARNYMNEIANMGFGGGGTSGYYSNMNRQYPGVGSLLQQGQKAANVKYLGSTASNLAKGNIKEAAKSGIGYALNQNPYIAGINTFNQLTGGIRFDKMLGMGPKKPRPTAAQQKAEMDYQTMLEADRNRYLTGANRAADSAQRYEEYLTNERNAIRDLEQNGPSARSLAPMLGQFAAQNYASEGAARSNTAANLSRRGISPTSGLALGAEAAVDQGLAATRGQQSSAVMNQVMDMLQQRRGAMLGIDAAGRKSALDREESMMDTASTLGLKGREMDMTERRYNDLRDQQMFERRQAEQASLGKFAGQFGPALMAEYQRYQNRGTQPSTISPESIVADFNRPEARSDSFDFLNGPTGTLPNPSTTAMDLFNQRMGGPSAPTVSQVPEFGGPAYPGGPSMMTGSQFLPDATNRSIFSPYNQPSTSYDGLDAAPDAFGRTGRVQAPNLNALAGGVDTQARSDVFNMQNPYALDGQIIEFQGQFFRKTPNGWEQLG